MLGVINVLKPPGMTSHNVVSEIRRLLKIKKVGHMGTLDPGAAGVLPVCVGKATRLFPYLVNKDKEYIFEMQFGETTDTLDAYGEKIGESTGDIQEADLKLVLEGFQGLQWQTPPMYSALKMNGKKMYELARQGVEVEMEKKRRQILISELEYLKKTGENRFLLRTVCSRGTYVRTLCKDIAEALGACAYMSFLLRSRVGQFDLASSWSIDELEQECDRGSLGFFEELENVLRLYPRFDLPSESFSQLRNGVALSCREPDDFPEGQLFCVYCQNKLFGLGSWKKGVLKLDCFLYDEE